MTLHLKDLTDVEIVTAESVLPRRGTGFYEAFGKRIFDLFFVLMSAPIVVPLIALIALAGAMTDRRNPIYRQPRVGRDGKVFLLLKLRTMVPNAENVLENHLQADPIARREWDRHQKLRDDPRITAFGMILRKSSLDELPQLWNVLRGDMSLIGPRPIMVEQKPIYPGDAYYHMRPGLSGLWQVSDRNHASFAERAKYDLEYYNKISVRIDLQVMARTFLVMLRGTGY